MNYVEPKFLLKKTDLYPIIGLNQDVNDIIYKQYISEYSCYYLNDTYYIMDQDLLFLFDKNNKLEKVCKKRIIGASKCPKHLSQEEYDNILREVGYTEDQIYITNSDSYDTGCRIRLPKEEFKVEMKKELLDCISEYTFSKKENCDFCFRLGDPPTNYKLKGPLDI